MTAPRVSPGNRITIWLQSASWTAVMTEAWIHGPGNGLDVRQHRSSRTLLSAPSHHTPQWGWVESEAGRKKKKTVFLSD